MKIGMKMLLNGETTKFVGYGGRERKKYGRYFFHIEFVNIDSVWLKREELVYVCATDISLNENRLKNVTDKPTRKHTWSDYSKYSLFNVEDLEKSTKFKDNVDLEMKQMKEELFAEVAAGRMDIQEYRKYLDEKAREFKTYKNELYEQEG